MPRRKGTLNGQGVTPVWDPKNLTAKHIAILYLCLSGIKSRRVAEQYNVSRGYVLALKRSPKGKKFLKIATIQAENRLREETLDKFTGSTVRAIENIHDVLHNEVVKSNAPLSLAKFSMDFLKSTGRLKSEETESKKITNNIIGNDAIERLTEAMEQSNKISKEIDDKSIVGNIFTTGDRERLLRLPDAS